ncbi:hypothetical protein [Nocardia harenae]|uniref:hypothetical protein n=1 Tax=Nocardia harenae TaxID=358707 RepID=UPI00083641CF|nr:hypothetical protein [Nocardia harenae]
MEPEVSNVEWQRVLTDAEAGELSLNPNVGQCLDTVCDDYLLRLEEIYMQVVRLQYLDGFGGFPSSRVLEDKFSQKATGAARSLEAVLLQHMDAVKLAKQAVAKAIRNFAEQDLASGEYISGTTP